MSSRIAIYPGTFDPITNGHVDIVQRAASLFDSVIVAIAGSARKAPYFSLEERFNICREVFMGVKNIQIKSFEDVVVNFARLHQARYIVKGLRAVSDFDYELQMVGMNHRMAPDIETVFLPATRENSYISSTMIREIMALKGDVSAFVPETVIKYYQKKR